jgi:hypothetical protein
LEATWPGGSYKTAPSRGLALNGAVDCRTESGPPNTLPGRLMDRGRTTRATGDCDPPKGATDSHTPQRDAPGPATRPTPGRQVAGPTGPVGRRVVLSVGRATGASITMPPSIPTGGPSERGPYHNPPSAPARNDRADPLIIRGNITIFRYLRRIKVGRPTDLWQK